MKSLVIIGARGYGREAYSIIEITKAYTSNQLVVKGFLDDNKDALNGLCGKWPPIIGPVEEYIVQEDDVFFCALGDSYWREYYSRIILQKGGKFISIIHPTALISPSAVIGEGSLIGAFCAVSSNVSIGHHVMIQAFSNIGHDVKIGDYASIESYVFLGGYAMVGESATMHTKSSIIPHKSIGKGCVVGFGSVVMRNVKSGLHVFGNPATRIDY